MALAMRPASSRSSTSRSSNSGFDEASFKMPGQVDTVKEYFQMASQPPRHHFGKRVNNQARPHIYQEWDFLKSSNEPQWQQARGVRETRFHKGFERRKYENIEGAPPRSCNNSGEPFKPSHSARREALAYLKGECTGYNIISGDRPSTTSGARVKELYPSYGVVREVRGRRHFDEEHCRPKTRGNMNEYRQVKFYQEQKNSEASRHRQELLYKDGLTNSVKRTSVLGYGRGDMSSRGVSDNFQYGQL